MFSDPTNPLYLDSGAYNPLLDLQSSANGLPSWATSTGIRAQDLFGTCLVIFLMLAAGIVLLSSLLWCIHALVEFGATGRPKSVGTGPQRNSVGSSPRTSSLGGKEAFRPGSNGYEYASANFGSQLSLQQPRAFAPSRLRRTWLRFRPKGEAGAFHAAALYGNLLRLIAIFHLPITTFSMYQLVLGARASVVSRVFAALALVFISILIPFGIMFKVSRTPSGKLYDATRTLLSLGPMYNVYVEGKQMFRLFPVVASLITGIVVGAGQGSGIAQAVILVVIELAMLIIPAVWNPWGEGASMGAPGGLLGVIRVASMVMVMILSPVVCSTEADPAHNQLDMSASTCDWLTYAILLLQALAFVFFILMLLSKMIEGFIRLFGGVHFDESTHPLDGGIFAAIMDLDCLNGVRGGKAAARRRRKRGSKQLQQNVSAVGSLTTQMILDRHSEGVGHPSASDGQTPFLAAYSKNEEANFPVYQPPLGPPPLERRSWESRSDEPSTGHIMDAWHPPTIAGYASPGTYFPSAFSSIAADESGNSPQRSFSVVRGGRADYQTPYEVKDRSEPVQPVSSQSVGVARIPTASSAPTHARHRSSSALVEVVGNAPLISPSSTSLSIQPPGLRTNNEGLRPPALAIPRRRSLNNTKDEQETSPDPKESDSGKPKKGRRRSKGPAWLSKPAPDTDESDDEPGPARRKSRMSRDPIPFELVPTFPAEKRKGWRSALGLGRKKSLDETAELARDENKARKAALAAQSGALFAGVEAPTPSPRKKAFVVNRKSGVPSQAQAPSAELGGGEGDEGEFPRSFRVTRSVPTASPSSPAPTESPASRTSPSVTSPTTTVAPARGFGVIRPELPSPTTGSFVSSRPMDSRQPLPSGPYAVGGYPSSAFMPIQE